MLWIARRTLPRAPPVGCGLDECLPCCVAASLPPLPRSVQLWSPPVAIGADVAMRSGVALPARRKELRLLAWRAGRAAASRRVPAAGRGRQSCVVASLFGFSLAAADAWPGAGRQRAAGVRRRRRRQRARWGARKGGADTSEKGWAQKRQPERAGWRACRAARRGTARGAASRRGAPLLRGDRRRRRVSGGGRVAHLLAAAARRRAQLRCRLRRRPLRRARRRAQPRAQPRRRRGTAARRPESRPQPRRR